MSGNLSTIFTKSTGITGSLYNLYKCSFQTYFFSPMEHPFEAEREYQRALNAVKLERVFAKPFLGSLDGHRDGLTCVSKHPTSLSTLCSASADGEVRVWHLTERKCLASWQVFIAPFTYAILWLILFFRRMKVWFEVAVMSLVVLTSSLVLMTRPSSSGTPLSGVMSLLIPSSANIW